MVLTAKEQVRDFESAILRVQLVIADRFTPAIREASFALGKFGLAMYLAMPWYRRLWYDVRSGRFARNVVEGVRSL